MHMLDRRVQILLDRDRFDRVAREARRRGVPVAAVIREAIDRAVPVSDSRRRAAARLILSAGQMAVPDPDELRREITEAHERT
jgi:hypothetical protein